MEDLIIAPRARGKFSVRYKLFGVTDGISSNVCFAALDI